MLLHRARVPWPTLLTLGPNDSRGCREIFKVVRRLGFRKHTIISLTHTHPCCMNKVPLPEKKTLAKQGGNAFDTREEVIVCSGSAADRLGMHPKIKYPEICMAEHCGRVSVPLPTPCLGLGLDENKSSKSTSKAPSEPKNEAVFLYSASSLTECRPAKI